ncbi:MAG: hypothetical protein IMZ71_01180 [Chloroflexi bacterium]|nr:hypothetical protein [Chloroflexota bacterium]
MITKECRECGQIKPIDEFYVHPAMGDGYLNKCKECVKARLRRYRLANPERSSAIDKAKYERVKSDPEYHAGRLGYQRAKRTPETMRAHALAQRHLAANKPAICESCLERPAQQAHHPDYQKPLEVIWLCVRCHMRLHHASGVGATN